MTCEPLSTAPAGRRIRLVTLLGAGVLSVSVVSRLGVESDIEIVASATSPQHLGSVLARFGCDVLLVDVDALGPAGLTGKGRASLEGAGGRMVALASSSDARLVIGALRAGFNGWVLKQDSVGDLVAAIRAVHRGLWWVSPRAMGRLLRQAAVLPPESPEERRLQSLTERELDVLRCLVEGLPTQAVAQRLFMSVNTVRTHRQRIIGKLGVHSVLEAVALARRFEAC